MLHPQDEVLAPLLANHRAVGPPQAHVVDGDAGDLPQFDPVATQLDLIIQAAVVANQTVAAERHKVSGPIKHLARERGQADEALRGKFRLIQIPGPDSSAADVQLASGTQGDLSAISVQDVEVCIPDGAPDGNLRLGPERVEDVNRCKDGRFGRSVAVGEPPWS